MTTARAYHTATLLPNGQVLVAGGHVSVADLSTAELYDPSAGTFSLTGSLATARSVHTATLLPNGKVLVSGGLNNQGSTYLASAELYDPSVGAFAPTGVMSTSRQSHTATLLPNGEVLIVGGAYRIGGTGVGGELSSAELYNPSTGLFTATVSMETARFEHTATLLPNGEVLVAGGNISPGPSAELYQ